LLSFPREGERVGVWVCVIGNYVTPHPFTPPLLRVY
jgi:hypothetical protein